VRRRERDEVREVRRLGPGDVFGETAILTGSPRTATVTAIDEVTVKIVTRPLIEERLGPTTWLGRFVLALADRFREVDEKLARLGGR
jgi:serine/threonine-protein kinase